MLNFGRGCGTRLLIGWNNPRHDVSLQACEQADNKQHDEAMLYREPEQVGLLSNQAYCSRAYCNGLW